MSIEVKDLGKNRVEFSVSVDKDKFAEALQKAYLKNVKSIAIPGFRKGKAPRSIIERMYGEGIFFEDAVNELLPSAYENAVSEANLDVVSQPEISVDDISKDNGFTFTAKVYIRPVVTVSDYKGITAKKVVYTVKDEDVNAQLESLRDRNSRLVPVEDRGIENGDIANIDFEGFIDGKAFPGGEGKAFDLTIGSGQFIPGFEEQLIGHGTNDDVTVKVTFPEDYHAEELKGKDAEFKVKINKVTVKELPELDDEFAKDISEFDTLEEYKADMAKKMQENLDKRSETEFENAVLDKIEEGVEIDIPEPMIEDRINMLARDMENGLMQQGINREMYLKYTGMDEKTYLEQFRGNAEKQVKSLLILNAVAKAENLSVSDEEFDKEIDDISAEYGMEKDKILELVRRENIEKDLLVRKAIEFLRDNAVAQEISEEEAKAELEKETKEKAEKAEKEEKPKKTAAKKPAAKKTTAKSTDTAKSTAKKTTTKKAADTKEKTEKKTASKKKTEE